MRLLFQCEVNRCVIRLASTARNEGSLCRYVSKWLLELVKSFKRKYFSKQNQGENLRCYSQRLKYFSWILSLLVHGMTPILRQISSLPFD